jgi:hypothetical protein
MKNEYVNSGNSLKRALRHVYRPLLSVAALVLFSIAVGTAAFAWDGSGPLVVDHQCTGLSSIPAGWIESVKSTARMYYGHTSHGEQVTGGMTRIEQLDPFYAFSMDYRKLPAVADEFSVNDDLGVSPELFWKTSSGMERTRNAIGSNPEINISMFMWCDQLTYYTADQVEEYFDSMEVLEAEFPHVTFVYATGHAQHAGSSGYNRWLRNEQIRARCADSGKVLFDFADMDARWFNPDTQEWEQNSYIYGEFRVPIQHPVYEGDEWGHTTFESCEVKGRAMWWLAAELSGWSPSAVTGDDIDPVPSPALTLDQNFPNPFNPATRITFSLGEAGHARLDLFDASGRLVRTLIDSELAAATHEVTWNGRDQAGRSVASGVYFYSLKANGMHETRKMILLR